jgi:nucleoside-diphosphate-sugar epimerase
MKKKLLIIGGAGFIGHNIALTLKDEYEIFIIDGLLVNNFISLIDNRDNLPYPKFSKAVLDERVKLFDKNGLNIIIQDARDYYGLCQKINEIKPNIIIHLAAVSHANRSNKDPYSTFDHSFRTLENALDAVRNQSQLEHFIYFSSSMVYGNFKQDFVDENSICEPIGIYGALKFSGEKIVIAYNQVFDIPYTIIRPSALYGERCISRRVGQIFIENSLLNKEIIIDGDGLEKLDFTYIHDLVSGVKSIIERKESKNQIFNITFGEGRKIIDLIEILKKYFGEIKVVKKERSKLTPKRGRLSGDKARELIGYNPTWNLEKGYNSYIKWYVDFFERNKKNIET